MMPADVHGFVLFRQARGPELPQRRPRRVKRLFDARKPDIPIFSDPLASGLLGHLLGDHQFGANLDRQNLPLTGFARRNARQRPIAESEVIERRELPPTLSRQLRWRYAVFRANMPKCRDAFRAQAGGQAAL